MLTSSVDTEMFQSNPTPLGDLPADGRLRLAIALPSHNQSVLDATLEDLYNPASPNYRHWLTADEFGQQFGPTEQEVNQVVEFAQNNG